METKLIEGELFYKSFTFSFPKEKRSEEEHKENYSKFKSFMKEDDVNEWVDPHTFLIWRKMPR